MGRMWHSIPVAHYGDTPDHQGVVSDATPDLARTLVAITFVDPSVRSSNWSVATCRANLHTST